MEKENISLYDFYTQLFSIMGLKDSEKASNCEILHSMLKELLNSLTEKQIKKVNPHIMHRAKETLKELEAKTSVAYRKALKNDAEFISEM